uniref:Uncharacterized protein n=1 Tax=Oryza rufipogon TaxID=4529 RepID=A0A0E0R626_ORYRU
MGYNINETGDPVAWPSIEEAKDMWSKLMDMPEAVQKKWMQDSKTLLQQQIAKLQKKLDNLKAENYKREITNIISELSVGLCKNLDDLSPEMVKGVKLEVAKHREAIRNRIVELRAQGASSSVVVAPQEEIVAPHAFQFDLNEPAAVDDDPPIVREERLMGRRQPARLLWCRAPMHRPSSSHAASALSWISVACSMFHVAANSPHAKNMWSKLMDMSEATQKKWMQDSKTLLQQQIMKLQKKLDNLKAENYKREITNIISEIGGGHRKNLNDLSPEMVKNVKREAAKLREAIRNRIIELHAQGASSSVVVAPQVEIVAPHASQFDLNEHALV